MGAIPTGERTCGGRGLQPPERLPALVVEGPGGEAVPRVAVRDDRMAVDEIDRSREEVDVRNEHAGVPEPTGAEIHDRGERPRHAARPSGQRRVAREPKS